jgi:prepilin-type N-terminal cleavage/methylation domain-containing protein
MRKLLKSRKKGLSRAKSRGFTLIELLVVIAIIGILAVLVIVALGTARKKGRISKMKSDINSVNTMIGMYEDDTGDVPTVTITNALNLSALWPTLANYGKSPTSPSAGYRYWYSRTAAGIYILRGQGDGVTFECSDKGCQ